MASTPKQMKATGYLPNAAAAAYTVPATAKQAVVKEVFLCNTDAVPQTVTIYYVPSGGAVGGSTTLYSAYTLQAGETQRFSTSTVLLPGDAIQWLASAASKVVGAISGIEYT
jgi:hypothetical protein